MARHEVLQLQPVHIWRAHGNRLGRSRPQLHGGGRRSVNRTGFVGGLIPREDGAYGKTQQVLPRTT
jgi:hypothetical protein